VKGKQRSKTLEPVPRDQARGRMTYTVLTMGYGWDGEARNEAFSFDHMPSPSEIMRRLGNFKHLRDCRILKKEERRQAA